MSQAMRKLSGAISKTKTICIFINQIREKVGVMFGNPEVTPGGRALKFYASIRMEIRRSQSIKDGEDTIGAETKVKIVKNKVAPPFKQATFDIMYGTGISASGCILDMGVDTGIVDKAGSWYSYGDLRLGQGRENAKRFLEENPDIMNEIDKKIREGLGLLEEEVAAGEEK
jgi:recombination protein RecA